MSDTPLPPLESTLPELPQNSQIPNLTVQQRSSSDVSLIWLIPLIAILIGLWLGFQALTERGSTITITFKTAEGITIGTHIKYRNVDVGEVKSITLSEDHSQVEVTAKLAKQAKNMLVKDARFWVVRPRISGGSVSGLGTVLAGAHIGMDAGKSTDSAREFVGLERPPIVTSDVPGHQYTLLSDDIGSLDIGSPVYFRHIQAGQVVAFELSPSGKQVIVTVFVNTPYDRFINTNTRFWHAKGLDIKLDSNGIKINTESLVSILLGGVAFENIGDTEQLAQAPENTAFRAFSNQDEALKVPDINILHGVMVFQESVRGLSPGAQIDFRGIVIGEVISNSIDFDVSTKKINVVVAVDIYPDRLRSKISNTHQAKQLPSNELLSALFNRGLRGQLRTSNLLTGQLYIALDFFPNLPKSSFNTNKTPFEVPTTPGSLGELQVNLASIANKINKVPFEAIGNDLHTILNNANSLITQLDQQIAPDTRETLSDLRSTLAEAKTAIAAAQGSLTAIENSVGTDGQLQQDAHQTLLEVTRAAQSTRALVDYLERHPEALISGKKEDSE
ncbi:MAG: MCE family protein [Methylophilaceae bacterium]|nr:MCE family protein [Methylophilaceae bacterium]